MDMCASFYNYTCGKYRPVKNEVKSTKGILSPFSEAEYEMKNTLRKGFSVITTAKEVEPLQFVRQFYKSCKDKTYLDRKETLDLKELIYSLIPAESKEETIVKLSRRNFNFLFDIKMVPDPFNNSYYILRVDRPILGLECENWNNFSKEYREYAEKTIDFVFGREGLQVRPVVKFEADLSSGCSSNEPVERTPLYKVAHISGINFEKIIKELLPSIQSHHLIMIADMKYLTQMFALVAKSNNFIDYTKWRIMQTLGPIVHSKVAESEFDHLGKKIYGAEVQMEPEDRCIDFLTAHLPDLMGYFYVQFKKKPKKLLVKEQIKQREIIKKINETFTWEIGNSSWMSDETKIVARQKLQNLRVNLGYPDLNDEMIKRRYSGLTLEGKENWTSVQLIAFLKEQLIRIEVAKSKVDASNWQISPASVETDYDPVRHTMTIPLALMEDGIFFKHKRPDYINFAMFGSIVGHSMSHMFDQNGIDFGPNGQMVIEPSGQLKRWWSEKSRKEFSSILMSYKSLFQTSPVPPFNLNPENTINEIVADMSGIIHSINASLSNAKDQLRLGDGFEDFPPEEIFFIAYANVFCAKVSPEKMKQIVSHGKALPPNHRLDGSLYNLNQFLTQFGCTKSGDFMNKYPNKKIIWS